MSDTPITILLIEDNPGDARLIQALVSAAGASRFRLQIADRLAKGLAHLATDKYDVVLLDLTLPDSLGLDTLARTQAQAPDLPIIVLTGLDDEALAEQAVRGGAQDFLVKGRVEGDLLLRAIGYAIERKRGEMMLRASEGRLRAILDGTPFPIALVDAEGNNIEFWSHSALVLFGHVAPTAEAWYQLAYPDPDYRRAVVERWRPAVEAARRSSHAVNAGEYRVTCRDGSERICELFAAYVADRLVVTFNDITERQQAMKQLAQERILLRTLIDNLPDGIYVKDLAGRRVLSNRADLHQIGLPEAEVLGKTDEELFPEDIAKGFTADDQAVMLSGQPLLNREERLINRFGYQIWQLTSKLPLRDASGQVIGLVGVGHDITENKRTTDALCESEARLRAIVDNASDAIHLDNSNDEIIEANSRLCEMLGYSREELLTMRISDLQAPEVRGRSGSVLKDELMRYGSTAFESVNLHRSGKRIPVEVSVAGVEGAQGDLFVSIVRDITERKRAEAAIKQQLDELRRWHTATLGRETRIIDLKREVNAALARAGEPARYLAVETENL